MGNEAAPAEQGVAPSGKPSPWEWLPVAAIPVLAVVFLVSDAGSFPGRFAFWVGASLIPGAAWRLSGRRAWGVHRVCFAAGLTAFVLENPALRPDAGTMGKIADNRGLVVLGCVFSFTQPFWGALRIHRLLTDSGMDMKAGEAFRLCLVGSFFNIFLPGATGGDAYRVYAVAGGRRARLGAAIASVSLDRFLGFPSLVLVVLLGMALDYRFLLGNRILSGIAPFIFASGAVCLLLLAYLALAGRAQRRGGGEVAAGSAAGNGGWLRRAHHLLAVNVKRRSTLSLALLFGFLSHIACIASCLCFGVALGVEGVPPLRFFLIVPMAMAINAIPGAPGGVGQGELAMATLLDMAGPGVGNAQAGVMIMLLFRLSNLLIGVAGGIVYALGGGGGAAAGGGKAAWR